MDNKLLWNQFLEKIQDKFSPLIYDTFFMDTYIKEIVNNTVIVVVGDKAIKKNFEESYYEIIKNIFKEVTGTNFEFKFIEKDKIDSEENNETEKENTNNGIPYVNPIQANLNPNYTFENFVTGKPNKFAFSASLSVADNPGKQYNPFFIYGNSGLGKTHLMQAIGNYIIKESNKKVLYVTCDDFVNDFMSIWKQNKQNNFDSIEFFKNKYRSLEVLIIDDIQFLADKPKVQEEFFNTFNDLYQEGKQIIISSDSSPDDLKKLEDRLKTRFNWGLTVCINPPDFDLRIDILRKKINLYDLVKPIDEEVLEYIANNCTSDVRKLEGCITRLLAYTTMFNQEVETIDLETAKDALKETIISYDFMKNDITKIQQAVADYYKITVEDLKSKKRTSKIALPRQIAMYLCRSLTDESSSRIGLEFGGKDHATVLHACEKIEKNITKNESLEKVIHNLSEKIKQ